MEALTEDQKKFLEDCELKFSDRFTDADPEYKKVLENGIPPPPIVYPWYFRSRYNNRDRYQGTSRYNNREENSRRYNNREDNYNRGSHYNNYRGGSHHSRSNYRDRPY